MGFVVDEVVLGRVFSEYFGFLCQSSFHQTLHHHNHTGQATIGQSVASSGIRTHDPSMWRPQKLTFTFRNINKTAYAFYSRRSDSKVAANNSIGTNPNWELLAPRGYRFYMPGSVGPAWHDAYTTVHTQQFESASSHETRKKWFILLLSYHVENLGCLLVNESKTLISKEVGLEVKTEKFKYMLLSHARQYHDKDRTQFKYLGTTVTTQNLIQEEIKRRLNSEYTVDCVAQDCPMLLRRGVMELFPGTDIGGSDLTIVTLSQKTTTDLSHTGSEEETEREKVTKFVRNMTLSILCVMELFPGTDIGGSDLTIVTLSQKTTTDLSHTGSEEETEREKVTKFFVLAAQEVCMKLRLAGYWADFINPFSGRPYLTPFYSTPYYEIDGRSYCLDFVIKDHGDCKVISSKHEKSHSYVDVWGSGGIASPFLISAIDGRGNIKDREQHIKCPDYEMGLCYETYFKEFNMELSL
ncbi:hypothetical protein B7P43_G06938 [Cryptotermes secundus]|uniref:Uncharacterized protein n=1 Tax=Cryptotermes secundus TaxID=105785 RepID=A0A2J7PP26_9NEOP|nr:hypothetical protein B7P43_G06938 [Cryptotermes secundus]